MSDDAVQRSDDLDRRLQALPIIRGLEDYGKENRRLIGMVALSVGLDILLSIAFGVLAFQAHQTATKASSTAEQSFLQCKAGNEARAAQLKLWTYILSLPPVTTLPKRIQHQQEVQRGQFKAYINKAFAARDCHRLNSAAVKGIGPFPKVKPLVGPLATFVPVPGKTIIVSGHTETIIKQEEAASGSSPTPRPSTTPSQAASPTPSRTPTHSPSPTPTCTKLPLVGICRPIAMEASSKWKQNSNSSMNSNGTRVIAWVAVVLQGSLLCGFVTSSPGSHQSIRSQ